MGGDKEEEERPLVDLFEIAKDLRYQTREEAEEASKRYLQTIANLLVYINLLRKDLRSAELAVVELEAQISELDRESWERAKAAAVARQRGEGR